MTIQSIFRLYQEGADDGKGGAAGNGSENAASGAPAAGTEGAPASGLLAEAAAAEAAKAASAAAAAAGKPVRPDTIPEQFWDIEKGELKTDSLIKSWTDTRTALADAKKAQPPAAKAPEKPEDYKLTIPKGADGKPLPLEIKPDDQAVALAQKAAHAAGISQEQFDKFMGGFITGAVPLMPQAPDTAAEKALLGPNADAAIAAVHAWGKNLKDVGLWSDAEFQEIIYMGSTATGIKALLKVREMMGEKPISLAGAVADGLPSKEELYAKVADPKYDKDPAFRAEVDKQFQQVFGTQPAGSSESGLGVGRR